MLFIYLYHSDLYSDLWNCDLYFSPAKGLPETSYFCAFSCKLPVRDTELGTKHFTKVCIKRFREKIGNLLAWNVYNLGNFYYFFSVYLFIF